jgi:hypothetical protein
MSSLYHTIFIPKEPTKKDTMTAQRNSNYASSIASESTTYSSSKPEAGQDQKQKRSMGRRVRNMISELGTPPTRKYDIANGRKPVDITGLSMYSPPQRI